MWKWNESQRDYNTHIVIKLLTVVIIHISWSQYTYRDHNTLHDNKKQSDYKTLQAYHTQRDYNAEL